MLKNKDGSITFDADDVDLLCTVLQYGLIVADQLGASTGDFDGESIEDTPAENVLLNAIEHLEERGVTVEELSE
jgi:hypothetical protein